MKKYTIVPDCLEHQFEGLPMIRLNHTYLHGDLEKKYGFDCFDFLVEAPTQTGIHDCLCEGVPCLFFYWDIGGDRTEGLVVLESDIFGLSDAYRAYKAKKLF